MINLVENLSKRSNLTEDETKMITILRGFKDGNVDFSDSSPNTKNQKYDRSDKDDEGRGSQGGGNSSGSNKDGKKDKKANDNKKDEDSEGERIKDTRHHNKRGVQQQVKDSISDISTTSQDSRSRVDIIDIDFQKSVLMVTETVVSPPTPQKSHI